MPSRVDNSISKKDNNLSNQTGIRVTDPEPPARWSLQGRGWLGWVPALLVALVALGASMSGIRNDFAQDDVPLIFEDTRVHSLGQVGEILSTPYWPAPFHRDLYRPLATLSFAVQWVVAGGAPVVYRVVSYLLYVAVSLALLGLARRLLPPPVGLGVALLFAAHPVHVEAVALAVNQGEQWVGLLSLLVLTRYIDLRRRGDLSARDWGGLGLLYLIACLFKEHAVVMPGFLIAAELALMPRLGRGDAARRLAPGFAALAVVGVTYLTVRSLILGDFVGSFTAEALEGQGRWGRFLTMLQVVPEWLRLLVWPAHLQGDYSPSVIVQATSWGVAQTLSAAILAGVVLVAWVLRRQVPAATFGILWAGIALIPVSNLLVASGIVMAERTLYLPSAGFLLAAGGILTALLIPETGVLRHRLARLAGVAAVALTAAGVIRSAVRHPDWRNQVYYWAKTVNDAPLSYRAHHAHAQLLYGLGHEGASISAFRTAMALFPPSWWIRNELGNRFRYKGECYPALDLYAESLAIEPEQPAVRASRIACFLYLARYDEAIAEANLAIAAGAPLADFQAYRAVADSARRVGAPPRTVQLKITDPDERW